MNVKAAPESNALDSAKLALAAAVLIGGLFAFHYFDAASKLFRVLGILGAAGLAVYITLQTQIGRQAATFLREAQVETRKVVWPTRQETIQVTFFVIIVVLIFAVLLWVLDLMLGASVQSLIG
jgi:preprotein translocase subunit SecE